MGALAAGYPDLAGQREAAISGIRYCGGSMYRCWMICGAVLISMKAFGAAATQPAPRDWIDPDTGHRVIQLSTQGGSRTLYFHDNSYTPDGDKLIFNTPSGVAVVDVTKLGDQPPEMQIVTRGNGAIMARRSREVYVSRGGGGGGGGGGGFGRGGGPVYAVNVD